MSLPPKAAGNFLLPRLPTGSLRADGWECALILDNSKFQTDMPCSWTELQAAGSCEKRCLPRRRQTLADAEVSCPKFGGVETKPPATSVPGRGLHSAACQTSNWETRKPHKTSALQEKHPPESHKGALCYKIRDLDTLLCEILVGVRSKEVSMLDCSRRNRLRQVPRLQGSSEPLPGQLLLHTSGAACLLPPLTATSSTHVVSLAVPA